MENGKKNGKRKMERRKVSVERCYAELGMSHLIATFKYLWYLPKAWPSEGTISWVSAKKGCCLCGNPLSMSYHAHAIHHHDECICTCYTGTHNLSSQGWAEDLGSSSVWFGLIDALPIPFTPTLPWGSLIPQAEQEENLLEQSTTCRLIITHATGH